MYHNAHLSRFSLIFSAIIFSVAVSMQAATARVIKPGQDEPAQQRLLLIPTPRHVSIHKGHFTIAASDKIMLARPFNSADQFSARQLVDEIQADLNVTVGTTSRLAGRVFLLGKIKENPVIERELHALRIQVPDSLGDQGYILNVSKDRVLVAANTSTGIFYGVQTLKQIIRANRVGNQIPRLTITDWPALAYRGWMDDISRGPIPTMALLKKEVRKLAEYKLNFFTLYTENIFKLEAYPDLAPQDGLTADQVKELTKYAEPYHIQLVGNFQSFGHMYKTLSDPFYYKMRETENVLCPVVPQTYQFLSKVYSEIVPAYSSKFFNINCDETFDLGMGKSKALVDSLGIGTVYADHINKVYDLLTPYHKTIMMWGDIADEDTSIVGMLPKNIIMLPWNYSPAKSFDGMIKPFVNDGFRFMVAPGVGCWSQIWPSLQSSVINISNFVRDGAKYGTIGMLNTAWDDDGENFFNYNWFAMIWGAECSWKPAPPDTGSAADNYLDARLSRFENSFNAIFYGNPADSVAQTFFRLDSIRSYPIRNILSDPGFWKEPLDFTADESNDSNATNNLAAGSAAARVLEQLKNEKAVAKRNVGSLIYAIFAARRVEFETRKNIFGIRLRQAMINRDSVSLAVIRSEINPLLNKLHSLKMEYVRLWGKENRTWWLNKILDRYDELGNSLINLDKTVIITPSSDVVNGLRTITLSTVFNDKPIYYTTDNTVPTLGAKVYTGPFTIGHSSPIRAGVEEYGQVVETAHAYVLVDKAIGKLYKLESKYSSYDPAYAAGGDSALVDGLLGGMNVHDGRWQGYQGQNVNIILDMKKETSVREVGIRFFQNSYGWILLPKEVKVLFSDNGTDFHQVADIQNTISPELHGTIIHEFEAHFAKAETRYIQVIGVYPGTLPAGHPGAGSPSFMFSDEVIVK